jgi:2-oxoacid:acceptor oxidoreductase delta subunit (pyruvate/2-ketoisovalerate family)
MITKGKVFGPDPRFAYTYRELPIGATAIGLSDDLLKTGTWRMSIRPEFRFKTPPCSEGCPAGVDVRGFIALIKQGRFTEAHSLYLEEHPFPAICGRVCFRPCEAACNRKEFDDAVGINALERFVGDREGTAVQSLASSGKRVAVIGSGPAGMACSYYLARLGHSLTVFESLNVVGGLLRTGIPDYRLPAFIVEKEVEKLRSMGIEFRTGQPINKRVWRDLESYDAVVLAHGASQQIPIPFTLSSVPDGGIISGLDFLKRVNLGESVSIGRNVIVVGGGNTAVDAARVALRLGASPRIVYRRSRAEMPAFQEEIEDAIEEGIEILFLTSPIVIEYRGSGIRIKCVTNRLISPDGDGRPGVVPIDGSDFFIEADTIISAIGEMPDVTFLPKGIAILRQSVEVDAMGSTSAPALFACGDAVGGVRTVVHAIGSAKKAAVAIDRYLKGQPLEDLDNDLSIGEKESISFRRYFEGTFLPEPEKVVRFADLNADYFTHDERQVRPKVPREDRAATTEVYEGLSMKQALAEAGRCLGCGMCDYCDNCYLFCPDSSVVKQESGETRVIDYEYCKGCGICAQECPVGLIEMVKEV